MPLILEAACTRCSYAVRAPDRSLWVTLDDGSAALCPHPSEQGAAEALTGRPFAELQNAGRVHLRYAFVCLGCGHVDSYAPPLEPGVACLACGSAGQLAPLALERHGRGGVAASTIAIVASMGSVAACATGVTELPTGGAG